MPSQERAEFLQRLRTISEGLTIAAQLDWDLSMAQKEDHILSLAPNRHICDPTITPNVEGLPLNHLSTGESWMIWPFINNQEDAA